MLERGRRAAAGGCAYFREGTRSDGGCSSMETPWFCHHLNIDKSERVNNGGARGMEGTDTRVSGNHPN